ncbi:MAG TPA: hypothetical protein DEQ02_05570 [Ruminococcaceae bacterium]|nr:hypothetical protein [Oscillospiraceae bacterium]
MSKSKVFAAGVTRNSNLELLRIVAMILIVAFHQLGGPFVIDAPEGGKAFELISDNWKVYAIIRAFHAFSGDLGNILFAMISGYFLIKATPTIYKTAQTALKFYGLLLYNFVFAVFLSVALSLFTPIPFAKINFNTIFSLGSLWYLGSYLFLLAFSPIINKWLNKLSRKAFTGLCIMVITIMTLLDLEANFLIPDSRIRTIIGGYLIGALLGRFNILKKIKTLPLVFMTFLPFIYYLCAYYFKMRFYHQTILESANNLPTGYLVWFAPIALFELFRRMQITSRFINRVAATTLFVYISHSVSPFLPMLREYAYVTLAGRLTGLSPWLFDISYLFLIVGLTAVNFIVGSAFGMLYNLLIPHIKKLLLKVLPISVEAGVDSNAKKVT